MAALDFSKAYKVADHGGIAWRLEGYRKIRSEDYEWSGIEEEDRDWVLMHMVGDDQTWAFEVKDITPIEEDEYCPECGQIGCKAYG